MNLGFQAKVRMTTRARSLPDWRPRKSPSPKRHRRIGVIVSLALFVVQFSLSLLLHPINQILCLEELNGSAAAAAHNHHHDAALSPAHPEPTGDTLQHCKDTLFGIAVTPMQPFSLPFATSLQSLTTRWASSPESFQPLIARTLAPPFQPPRA